MKETVTVTPGMIAEARRFGIGDKGHCAIAVALVTADPDRMAVKVDKDFIRWTDRKTRYRYVYPTPPKAQKLIEQFDDPEASDPRALKFPLDVDRPISATKSKARPAKRVVKKPPSESSGPRKQSNRRDIRRMAGV